MQNRFFNLGVLVSAIVIGLVAIAWLLAGSSDPITQHLSLTHDWHLSVDRWGADARIEIFNGGYGPYSGGIYSVSSPYARAQYTPRTLACGDRFGIYFRRVLLPTGGPWWTLSISLAYPLLAAMALPSVWVALRTWRNSVRRSLKVRCL